MYRAVPSEGAVGGSQAPQLLEDQLTLTQPGEGAFSPPSTTSPLGFSDFATALMCDQNDNHIARRISLGKKIWFRLLLQLNIILLYSFYEIFHLHKLLYCLKGCLRKLIHMEVQSFRIIQYITV